MDNDLVLNIATDDQTLFKQPKDETGREVEHGRTGENLALFINIASHD